MVSIHVYVSEPKSYVVVVCCVAAQFLGTISWLQMHVAEIQRNDFSPLPCAFMLFAIKYYFKVLQGLLGPFIL